MHRMQRDHCCSRDRITCRRAFAVVGGVLAIPTWEWATVTARMREVTAAARAERLEHSEATTEEDEETVESESVTSAALENPMSLYKRPTDLNGSSHDSAALLVVCPRPTRHICSKLWP